MAIKRSKCKSVICALGIIFAMSSVSAAQSKETVRINVNEKHSEVILSYLTPVTIEMSATLINRLNFKDNRITKVVGDTSKFSSIISQDGSNLFLSLNVPAGETLNISVIDNTSEVFDLHIKSLEKNTPSLVVLKHPKRFPKDKDIQKLEALKMIKAMQTSRKDKYYISDIKRQIKLKHHSDLEIKQYVNYRYGKIFGAGFEVKNKSKKDYIYSLEEKLSQSFDKVVAIKSEKKALGPKGSTRVFLVFEGEEL